jgi:exopolyphosphatase/guanosine-5'-triphosphate,3'-diphosphate pyrophosphatase
VRIAALDVGSNSFHLVVVDVDVDLAVDGDGAASAPFRVVASAKEMVRIGEGTLRTRIIPTDGFERGLDALARLREIAEQHRPDVILAVATAAIREADNGDAFVRAVRTEAGLELVVVDAHEEARLVYLGARRALGLGAGAGARRVALFDLGGGSLEIIVADGARIFDVRSLPLGGLRLAETWLDGDPPDGARLAEMRVAIGAALAPTMEHIARVGYDFVALAAGTSNALRAILAGRAPDGTPPTDVTLETLRELESELAAMRERER